MLKTQKTDETKLILDKSQLTEIFYSGCNKNQRIGLEFEKLPVNSKTFKASSYFDVSNVLKQYKKEDHIGLFENGALLGLKSENGTITLEPGSQTELSYKPTQSLKEISAFVEKYNKETSDIAKMFSITWLGYGIQPVSTYSHINIIPKMRYRYMTQYLPTVAKRPLVMMRETSGIQASIDYESEEDAMKKFRLALKLSPIVSAAFANSPVRNGRLSRYKSFRAASWLDTDNDRCGLVSSKAFGEDFSFDDYAEILLDVPMIFIEREIEGEKQAIKVENLTFRKFLKEGWQGYNPEMSDWELHLSLYFPDVRLKNYIEIRNHDNQRKDLIMAVPAFWKGLLYNKDAMDSVEELLKDFSYFDFEYLRRNTPKNGTNIQIKHRALKDIVKEIVDISYSSLKQSDESHYLEPLKILSDKGITPADLIIDKWENHWNGDVSKLVEYSAL